MKLDRRAVAAAVLIAGGCARPPLADLDAAWRSYQDASAAGGAQRDPERFQQAGAALVAGQDAIDQGDFDRAKESLNEARRLSDAVAGPGAQRPPDSGFTEVPPSKEGVQLSPLLNGAPNTPADVPPAPVPPPPVQAAPSAPPTPAPSALPPAALPPPERLAPAPPPEPLPDLRSQAAPKPSPSPEDTARAIREERERLVSGTAAPPAPPPPEPSSGPRTHVVKRGETLTEIALHEYHDEAAWKLIYAANRDRMSNPSDVRAGMKLELPPPGTAPADVATSPSPIPSTYTVRNGENLRTIAHKVYGNPAYWKLILDANQASLPDPDDLRPGTKLVLPPKPAAH